jgi:hypothetical protein
MPKFLVEQYELYVTSYKVEANTEEEAKELFLKQGSANFELYVEEFVEPVQHNGNSIRNVIKLGK